MLIELQFTGSLRSFSGMFSYIWCGISSGGLQDKKINIQNSFPNWFLQQLQKSLTWAGCLHFLIVIACFHLWQWKPTRWSTQPGLPCWCWRSAPSLLCCHLCTECCCSHAPSEDSSEDAKTIFSYGIKKLKNFTPDKHKFQIKSGYN